MVETSTAWCIQRSRRRSPESSRSGRPDLELSGERLRDRWMHQAVEVSTMLRDFTDDARADVGRLHRRDHEDGLEVLGHMSVHQRHLELVLEVADGAKPANVEPGADFFREVDEEAFELSHLDVLVFGGGG